MSLDTEGKAPQDGAMEMEEDPKFKQYENEIRQYFETHHKVADGYLIVQDEILLVVKRG